MTPEEVFNEINGQPGNEEILKLYEEYCQQEGIWTGLERAAVHFRVLQDSITKDLEIARGKFSNIGFRVVQAYREKQDAQR